MSEEEGGMAGYVTGSMAVSATLRREVSLGVSGTELITYLVLQLERHRKVRGK